MESTVVRSKDVHNSSVEEYRTYVRHLIQAEANDLIAQGIRAAAIELMEEQRKAIRQAVEEHRLMIKQIVEEDKAAIHAKVDELRRAIIRLVMG